MKLQVDRQLCSGHARCNTVSDELFPLDDDGYSALVKTEDVPSGQENLARQGVGLCPEGALRILSGD
jgi:ferredoxin